MWVATDHNTIGVVMAISGAWVFTLQITILIVAEHVVRHTYASSLPNGKDPQQDQLSLW